MNLARYMLACCALAVLSVAVLCAEGAISAQGPNSPAVTATIASGRIVVLGDSLAVSPSRSENFVTELRKRLSGPRKGWTIANAGVRGDRTANGLKRFETALTRDTKILILELGVNDGLRGVELSTIEKNLASMIEQAQARGIRVLLCGMMVPPRYGWTYAVNFQALFPRLATRYNVPLVPFLLEGVALTPDMNGPDGFHPNKTGAERMADTVWPYLEPLL